MMSIKNRRVKWAFIQQCNHLLWGQNKKKRNILLEKMHEFWALEWELSTISELTARTRTSWNIFNFQMHRPQKERERERQTVKVETFIAQKTATAGLIRWIRCPRQLVHQKKTDNANGKKSIWKSKINAIFSDQSSPRTVPLSLT